MDQNTEQKQIFPQGSGGGVICALIGGLCYGLVPVFAKMYYNTGGDAASFLFIRNLLFVFSAPLIIRLAGHTFAIPKDKRLPLLRWIMAVMGVYFFYFYAVEQIDVSLAIILFFLYPTYIVLLEWLTKGEPASRLQVIGICGAWVGLIAVVGPGLGAVPLIGIGLAVAAGICMALDLFQFRRLSGCLPVTTTLWYSYIFMLIPFAAAVAVSGWHIGSLPLMALAAVISTGGDLAVSQAVKSIGAVRAGGMMNLEPVFAIVIAALLLGESMTLVQYAGAAAVLCCLFLVNRRAHP